VRLVVIPLFLALGCVPAGNSTPSISEGGASTAPTPTFRPSVGIMTMPFEDNFDRKPTATVLAPLNTENLVMGMRVDAGEGGRTTTADGAPQMIVVSEGGAIELGPDWATTPPKAGFPPAWRIENGRLCGQNAQNHGVWLTKVLPPNARIEFDAISDSPMGDLKAEVWGDGQSAATGQSYNNATSYLTIFGGWKNTLHVLARLDEHAENRRVIKVQGPAADDPRERPVGRGQAYHFKIERTDGRTVRWFIDNNEMLSWADDQPLVGFGHDHFGFNDWEVKVCFDNVKVTPLL
jgi:hypothetical protein